MIDRPRRAGIAAALVAIAWLAGCQSTPPGGGAGTAGSTAAGGATPGQAHGRLIEAFNGCNEGLFVGAYAPYFNFTTSTTRQAVTTADGLRAYLAAACRTRPNATAAIMQQSLRVNGAFAQLAGQYRFKVPTSGQAVEVVQNFTLVMERIGERWLAVAHHISVAP